MPPPKKKKLTKKERKSAKAVLMDYRKTLCEEQHLLGNYTEHPISLFLPSSLQTLILDKFLAIESCSTFNLLLNREKRKAVGTERRRNAVSSESEEDEEPYDSSELESDSSMPAALLI
ncbi:hypothetical protein GGX14DRAFT_563812 [Mycena pura]|uniref:Uncharacterized protein n=1 Tax=Mycena pura TaxID=153505 RepID=A0AAD6VI43_9AGAR|nr:hypothetical protein GGX14DRAFT_563812 [Mycena pura]